MIKVTVVSPEDRITNGCLGLWDGATKTALEHTLAVIRQNTLVPIGMQIAYTDCKASSARSWEGEASLALDAGGWKTMGPSSLPQRPERRPPHEVTDADLAHVRDRFVDTTRRVVRLGLSAIRLHAAHGYLLHEFLSPAANQRTDAFSSSRENRVRYPLEIFDAVHTMVPDNIPVGMRVSATDQVEDGQAPENSVAFAQVLYARGCDWIDASSGGVSPLQQIPLSTGYQVPFAEETRNEAGIPTITVGLISEAHEVEAIVTQGRTDLVAVDRAFLCNPHWAWTAAAELGATVRAPPQY